MIESQAAVHLLTQVQQVVHNHEKTLRTTGNGFSFTHALNIESDEARFHTKFIGYLLNPKAGHHQGDKFLKLFFDVLDIQVPTNDFKVEMEKPIGKVDWENVEGGRIDLLISNSSNGIAYAIELKIYAIEQPKQLERYRNFLNRKFKNEKSMVYYLTLVGSESSYHKGFEKYKSISFSNHIIDWMERCRLASIDQPLIRETLSQYIANIKRLTNQNPDDQMSDEIINLITNSDTSFKAFEAIASVQTGLYQRFGENLVETLKNQPYLNDNFKISLSDNFPQTDSSISIFSNDDNFQFQIYWLNPKNVGFGLLSQKKVLDSETIEIRKDLGNKLLSLELNIGNFRSINSAFDRWFCFFNLNEFTGHPNLTFESWKLFQSKEMAERTAFWVKEISVAYHEVLNADKLSDEPFQEFNL